MPLLRIFWQSTGDLMATTVERWGIYELILAGPADGNPCKDVDFGAEFRFQHRVVKVRGFYDGKGLYKVRMMPDEVGEWSWTSYANIPQLNAKAGTFVCSPALPGNHGPVGVTNQYFFAYADGTPYHPFGTTCYAWVHQGDELEQKTLASLEQSGFNKIRMCVFPKDYAFNKNEPEHFAYERDRDGKWDFYRFNPAFFHHLEHRISALRDLGIEADLILFHPYDRWGFSDMPTDADDLYLRYLVARLAAYRNVWWSLANEYDLMKSKRMEDWDRFFKLIQAEDPSQHLRSVHNCRPFYDHSKPWVTHCSVQHSNLARVREWREQYRKPVVVDECCYEGNIEHNWGNISALELVHRLWLGVMGGGYVGHGETYLHPEDTLWWAKGGTLHGSSWQRFNFLRSILEQAPSMLEPVSGVTRHPGVGKPGSYYLFYTGEHQPARIPLTLPDDRDFQIEIIDPWEMRVDKLESEFCGSCMLVMPGKPYLAVRIQKK
jgi:hypothetical protein